MRAPVSFRGRATTPRRRGHGRESGLTLIELLVSITVLSIVGVAMAAAMDAGIKALGVGGAGDRVAGARDLGAFEQALGADVTRASCIYVRATGTTYGGGTTGTGCTMGLLGPGPSACTNAGALSPCDCTQSGTVICMAWPHIADSTCHLAMYVDSAGPPNTVLRKEWSLRSGSWTALATVRINAGSVATPAASAVPATAPPGYSWPSSLRLTVTSTAVQLSAASGSLYVHPLVKNPASPTGYTLC